MQEQFSFSNNYERGNSACALALLLGRDYFAYSVYDVDENKVVLLKRFRIDQLNTINLNTVLQHNEALAQHFDRIVTVFDFDTNTLLPVDLNSGDNTPLLYLNGADSQDHIISEVITDWDIANVYSVPYSLLNWVVSNFPSSQIWHVQTLQIKNTGENTGSGSLYVDFANNRISVTGSKGGCLFISKSYPYKSPADVLFYLLKICETFNLEQETVQLSLSGLIDRNSGMFKTLYDYFLNIDLKLATWQQPEEYPLHYFTLLNQIALCES